MSAEIEKGFVLGAGRHRSTTLTLLLLLRSAWFGSLDTVCWPFLLQTEGGAGGLTCRRLRVRAGYKPQKLDSHKLLG